MIKAPVISLRNEEILWGQMLNYVSNQEFFLKLTDDEPYEQIRLYLEKYDLSYKRSKLMSIITLEKVFNYCVMKYHGKEKTKKCWRQ